jgi:hypothetical protein
MYIHEAKSSVQISCLNISMHKYVCKSVYDMKASIHRVLTLISILDNAGSRGNSTIFLPRAVSSPVLPKAPRIHSCNTNLYQYLTNTNARVRACVYINMCIRIGEKTHTSCQFFGVEHCDMSDHNIVQMLQAWTYPTPYMEFNKLSMGGGDIKSNLVRSSTPTAHKRS